MDSRPRPHWLLVLALVGTAAIALPGAAYLLTSSPGPAQNIPFTNEGTDLGARDVQSAITELAARVKAVESSQAAEQTVVNSQQYEIKSQKDTIAAQKSELTRLLTASQDQSIRLAGQEARLSTLESRAAENTPTRRRINYADEAESKSVTPDYYHLRNLGTFTKQHSTTSVFLAWNTHAEARGEPGTFCDFQLRIDSRPDTDWEGGGGRAVVYIPSGNSTTAAVSVYALFARVGAGSHTVSVWVRGSAATCRENPGNFPRSVVIEEGPRG